MKKLWYLITVVGLGCDGSSVAVDGSMQDGQIAGDSNANCGHGPERDGPYTRFTVANDTSDAAGFIDPSVEYPVGAHFGLMTYTTGPDAAHVHIAIAASTDAAASWHYQAEVTHATPITIDTTDNSICGQAQCSGTLVDESSSLVIDPSDPDPARRLKVFAHEYFFGTDRQFLTGYLAMYTAAMPAGPWTRTKLFGWPSSSSLSTAGVQYNIHDIPELAYWVIVAEPGALARTSGELDLALGCPVFTPSGTTIDIRLVRSTDHAATWHYVSKLLAPDDGAALGAAHRQLNGADLFEL